MTRAPVSASNFSFKLSASGAPPEMQTRSDEKSVRAQLGWSISAWYIVGTQTSLQAWTAVYVDFKNHELVATRARRVNGADGRMEGVVATDLSLRAIEEFVRGLRVSPNGFAFVVEGNGDLVAASNAPNVLRRDDGTWARLNAGKAPNPLLVATYTALKAELAAAAPNQSGARRFTAPDGSQMETGYARVTDSVGLDWTIVVAVPRSEQVRFADLCVSGGFPHSEIGVVEDGAGVLEVQGQFVLPLAELSTAHASTLPAIFAAR